MEARLDDRHGAKVARIARQLRERTSGRPVSLRKKSVAHQVPKPHDLRRRDDKMTLQLVVQMFMRRDVHVFSPNGAKYDSPGQRPG